MVRHRGLTSSICTSHLGISLEETIGYLVHYAEEQGWPAVPHITTEDLEDYFAYSRIRKRGYGERKYKENKPISSSYLNRQYRQLRCLWGWLVEREFVAENIVAGMKHPKVEENVVPTVSDDQMTDLLSLLNPRLARTQVERFYLLRNCAVINPFADTPGRLNEIATMRVEDVILEEERILVMGKGRPAPCAHR